MDTQASLPRTLVEAIRHFSDPDICLNFVVNLRWSDGIVCPHCGCKEVHFISTRRIWRCKSKPCYKQFSVKIGTIMEDSPISLDKWLIAIWLIANCKNGISSYELARDLGITQKSAWFLNHRIRLAMQTGTFEKMSGQAEVDETFIGGKARNMHRDRAQEKFKNDPIGGKMIVLGILERKGKHSRVRTKVVPARDGRTLKGAVKANIKKGSEVFTDSHRSYRGLDADYLHKMVDHDAEEYVRGHVHTNGIENYWSLLKRTIKGTYVSVEPFHLFRYLDEQAFRFNNRQTGDGGRFKLAASMVTDKRLTYKDLTGKESLNLVDREERGKNPRRRLQSS